MQKLGYRFYIAKSQYTLTTTTTTTTLVDAETWVQVLHSKVTIYAYNNYNNYYNYYYYYYYYNNYNYYYTSGHRNLCTLGVIGVARQRLPVAADVPPPPKLDSDHVQTNHGKVRVKSPSQPEFRMLKKFQGGSTDPGNFFSHMT